MPDLFINVWVNVPSYILSMPHDGLFSFNKAFLQLYVFARFKAFKAPNWYSFVTSFPSIETTLSFNTSEGFLGILKPPKYSGHIRKKFYFFDNNKIISL